MQKRILLSLCILFSALHLNLLAQEADATEGCAPLTVKFTGPDQSSYFWDFDDATSSTEQNPENIFTVPDTYRVTLSETQNGPVIGEIIITVYPDISIDIEADKVFGCIDLEVGFTSDIVANSNIDLTEIKWTFGDGKTALGPRPTNVYTFADVFDVSVQLTTNLIQCNKTEIFPELIEAEDLKAEISSVGDIPCVEPAIITLQSDLKFDSRYTYRWDFGNGDTFTGFNPDPVTYDNFDKYIVSLIVSSPSGCIDTSYANISIGPPEIELSYPDTVCVGEPFVIKNATSGNRFDWRYGDPQVRIFERNLEVEFTESGPVNFRLLASRITGCESDTSFIIYVQKPNPSFRLEPLHFCSDADPKSLIATNTSYTTYIWNDEITTSPILNLPSITAPRDSLYINVPDSVKASLTVITPFGCMADTTIRIDYRLTEAYFIPNAVIGLKELNVTFTDYSTSNEEIVSRKWIYGDGQEMEIDPATVNHSHRYETCGIFYPRLIVEDAKGCIDTSKSVKIEIICCDDDGTITGGPGEGTDGGTVEVETVPGRKYCVDDIIPFGYSGVDQEYHTYTDNNRINHCWSDQLSSHQYKFPGTFPIITTWEYKGFIIDTIDTREIEICGARAEILYEKNCEDIYKVEFSSNSLNATELIWTYEGDEISRANNFSYTFSDLGAHIVTLSAENTTDECGPNLDQVTIYVTEPKADFELPDLMCDSQAYPLNATAAKDCKASCHGGYNWIFDFQRPRETSNPILEHQFARGTQDVTLVVEDVNGCKDTLTKSTRIYGIEAEMNMDTTTCLPNEKNLQDLSIADTTLVSWEWSFGSTEQNPTYTFDVSDLDPERKDTIIVSLALEDVLGCVDTIERIVTVLYPNFIINASEGSDVCVGQEMTFNVVDTADIKEFYDFSWEVDGVTIGTGEEATISFDEPGTYDINLNYIHKNGSCDEFENRQIDVIASPVSGFSSDVDSLDIICYPAQISFMSDPDLLQNDYDYFWQFGDQDFSEIPNPTLEFERGTHEILQIVTNSEGCSDTSSQLVTLVGPTGNFELDRDVICLNETIEFTIVDTSSVNNYIWNFGDGTVAENISPISHEYTFRPIGDSTIVTLTLESNETGCEVVNEIPIFINDVTAEIEAQDQLCAGIVSFDNFSTGAEIFEWDFGDGTSSSEFNPTITYENPGEYQVILLATDTEAGCSALDTLALQVEEMPEIYQGMPNLFTPNGNSANDFFRPAITPGFEDFLDIRTFRIYNRYGELVYDNQSTNGWDGNFNGGTAPPEVYAYYIEIDIDGCIQIVEKGNVTLVR